MSKEETNIGSTSPDNAPWYAVRTFNCQEKKVSRYLEDCGCVHFIPMTVSVAQTKQEKPKQILVPAVHNLLFVQKQGNQKQMMDILKACDIPVSIFHQPGSTLPCEIPAQDMIEIRLLCDPEYQTTNFMSQSEAEAMVGKDVRVVKGPFKGSIGKLVRKDKQYYFLKAIIGMGVMVRISRWYCEPL